MRPLPLPATMRITMPRPHLTPTRMMFEKHIASSYTNFILTVFYLATSCTSSNLQLEVLNSLRKGSGCRQSWASDLGPASTGPARDSTLIIHIRFSENFRRSASERKNLSRFIESDRQWQFIILMVDLVIYCELRMQARWFICSRDSSLYCPPKVQYTAGALVK